MATDPRAPAPGETRPLPRAWLALVLAPYAALVARFWFVTDDAFISFRYARNLAEGIGLRYNAGEHVPVEGYSNFLWVVLGAGLDLLGLDIVLWLPLVSAVAGACLLLWCWDLLTRRLGVPLAAALPAVLGLAVFAPFDVWATSGLATMPFALALALTLDQYCLRERPGATHAALASTALVLLRVEGFLWFGAILALAVVARRGRDPAVRRALLAGAAATAVVLAAHFALRKALYGDWFPATVHAKSGQPLAYLRRGLDYVATWYLAFLTPLAILPATRAALDPRWRRVGLPLILLAWAFPAYAVLTTGDFMAMGRFLVPGAALVAVGTGLWLARLPRRAAWGAGLALALVGALPGFGVHLVPAGVREAFRFRFNTLEFRDEVDQWRFQRDNALWWGDWGRALGAYAADALGPDASVVLDTIGAAGYRSGLFVYDQFGLVTREVAELPVDDAAAMASPGHDKTVRNDFFARHRPSILFSQVLVPEDARTAAATMGSFVDRLRAGIVLPDARPEQGWAPDFRRVRMPGSDELRFLFVWRATREGEDPARLLDGFRAELARLAATGEAREIRI